MRREIFTIVVGRTATKLIRSEMRSLTFQLQRSPVPPGSEGSFAAAEFHKIVVRALNVLLGSPAGEEALVWWRDVLKPQLLKVFSLFRVISRLKLAF